MVGVLGLTFALQFAALPGAAAEVGAASLDPTPVVAAVSAPVPSGQVRANDILALSAARQPAPTPAFSFHYRYRPREWVTLVADRLNMRDAGVTHLALWVASWPVRLDASETRVCLRVTLPMP